MHDWPYESLIHKLKAVLAEVDAPPDRPPAGAPHADPRPAEARLSTARAEATRPAKRTAQP